MPKLRQRKSSRGRIKCQVRRCCCQKIGRRLLMADMAEASLGGRTSVGLLANPSPIPSVVSWHR